MKKRRSSFPKGFRFFLFAALSLSMALVGLESFCFVALKLGDFWKSAPVSDREGVPRESPSPGFLYYRRQMHEVKTMVPDSLLDFVMKPGLATGGGPLEQGKIAISSFGWVKNNSDLNDPESAQPGELLILVSGGSSIFGDGLEQNENTVPSQLQVWLRKEARAQYPEVAPRIHVINAGVPGYNAAEEFKRFLFDYSFRRPALWIQVDGANEAWHIGKLEGSREVFKNKYLEGFGERNYRPFTPFFPATQRFLYRLISPLVVWKAHNIHHLIDSIEQPDLEQSLAERFEKLLDEEQGAAQAVGTRFAYFLQPTQSADERIPLAEEVAVRRHIFTDDYWPQYLTWSASFYGPMRAWLAKQRGRAYYDASSVFRDIREPVYLDPRHYNPLGSRLLAEKIGRQLWSSDLVPLLKAAAKTK